MSDTRDSQREGWWTGIAAYCCWGTFPLYFKLLTEVSPWMTLAHRIIWLCLFLGILISYLKRWPVVFQIVSNRAALLSLAGSTILIAINWFTFLYAVSHDQVVQTSLGYFITPLVNVALGVIWLKERLRRDQQISLAIAAIGVTILGAARQEVPVIALALAFSFAFYGLLRKTMAADSLIGLFVETSLMIPVACYLFLGDDQTERSTRIWLLLMGGGIITAIPLLLFAHAARRLPLSSIGFLQYIAPSLQLILATQVYGEPFDQIHAISFGLIWLAIIVFVWGTWQRAREGSR